MNRRLFLLFLVIGLSRVGTSAQTKSSNIHFYVEPSSFAAEGTWIPVDPKDHAAYQAETELDCDKRSAMCIEATADYFSGHPHISVVYFQIVKWDGNGIVASSAEGACQTRTLYIGFAAKHLSDTREAKILPDAKQKACSSLGVPPSEGWTMALKNSKAWNDERDREHMQ
jgi:hypothetical protein